MANVQNLGTYSIDTASSGGGDFLESPSIRVLGIFFTPNASGDSIVLHDLDTSGPSAGIHKLTLDGSVADQTDFYNLVGMNIVFPNGIWVASITASAVATLIIAPGGG